MKTPKKSREWGSPFLPKHLHLRRRMARLENGWIVWDGDRAEGTMEYVSKDLGLLYDFVALSEAADERILKFAQQYGPLGLCQHGSSTGHRVRGNFRCYAVQALRSASQQSKSAEPIAVAREPLTGWRRYAQRARGILKVAEVLRRGERPSSADWEWLWDAGSDNPKPNDIKRVAKLGYNPRTDARLASKAGVPVSKPRFKAVGRALQYLLNHSKDGMLVTVALGRMDTVEAQKRKLAQVLNHWIDECEVGVSIAWETGPNIDVRLGLSDPYGRGNRLLIVIAVQLLCAVLRSDQPVFCSECGRNYPPFRKPRSGERNYCPECGKTAADRNFKRKSRAKRGAQS